MLSGLRGPLFAAVVIATAVKIYCVVKCSSGNPFKFFSRVWQICLFTGVSREEIFGEDIYGAYFRCILSKIGYLVKQLLCNVRVARQGYLKETARVLGQLGGVQRIERPGCVDDFLQCSYQDW